MRPKLYYYLLFISLFSSLIFAQDFDESFLESLPDDVAADLKTRSESKVDAERTIYRRPSSYIKKPDLISDRFGAQVFSMMQTSLMPLNEPNFDGSYIIDFGDEIELQLVGQKSSITKLPVKRDGAVNIKDIGKVFISGLSLDEASRLIKTKIAQSYIGVEAFISLTNVRDIQIILAGNVYNPGPYTLNGNSNIFHGLAVAGGPSEKGSFRSIDLIRNNKKISTIDLYQTFIYGNSIFDNRLRSGDIIFVNPVKNIVSIYGAVNRPGEYELDNDEPLSSIISFANGTNAYVDLSNISLERILDGRIKTLPITNLSQFDNIKPNDGDTIFIREHSFRSIEILGAVINPGVYLMTEGDTLNDAIAKAGGYSINAYPFGGIYENLATKEINLKALEDLYKSFLDSLIYMSNSDGFDPSAVIEIISEVKSTPASGRIIANFENQTSDNQVFLMDGDKITIPERLNQVYVFGEVYSEGTTIYKQGEGIDYYLNMKGGLNKNADKKSIFLSQPNGETIGAVWNKNVFVNKNKEIKIYPGTIIYVPREINNPYASSLRAQAYATILGNIGVSLASISVLKD